MSILEQPTRHRARVAKPIMTLNLDSEGPVPAIAVRGEVDMSTAHLIDELAAHVIARRPARLILDLSRVTFFSAHGISALLRTQRAAACAGVTLTLRDAAPCVSHLLAATRTRLSSTVPTARDGQVDPVGMRRAGEFSPA
ncbi:STAS domain-containing protein [Micromonospora halophytica]|uniref:Anti-anti-sigma factor n=1 Tax=Micromonospora halophytica TaxID=47864 RepID=A0A1C5IPB0_9ACTN|nr:STAS domain-containing protein [Micromonospora halophytica]SCG60180.1 anti-anti-sigma factor [Micromonospora halophytica]